MQPLIDADLLVHELGWSSEFLDKETGENILFNFDRVVDLLDERINIICQEVGYTKPPILFFTNSKFLTHQENKRKKLVGEPLKGYVPNFREAIAVTKPYKGTRLNVKPFHFYNILSYLCSEYETIISQDGLEADDELGIFQTGRRENNDTIICSRDKDLRMVPGYHYSWECGKQRAIGPEYTDEIGWLEWKPNGKLHVGYGSFFFHYQMLTGDAVDNIPGLPGCGPVAARKILEGSKTVSDLHSRVKEAYLEKVDKEFAKIYFLEQANLLYIRQHRDKGYEFPTKR